MTKDYSVWGVRELIEELQKRDALEVQYDACMYDHDHRKGGCETHN